MVKAGILDMAKVSSNTLGQFKEEYSIFAVPYLFNGQQHYYDAMQKSEKVKELFMSTEDELHSHRLLCQWRQELLSEGRQALCGTVCIKGQEDTFMPNTTSMDMIEPWEEPRFPWRQERHTLHCSRELWTERRIRSWPLPWTAIRIW